MGTHALHVHHPLGPGCAVQKKVRFNSDDWTVYCPRHGAEHCGHETLEMHRARVGLRVHSKKQPAPRPLLLLQLLVQSRDLAAQPVRSLRPMGSPLRPSGRGWRNQRLALGQRMRCPISQRVRRLAHAARPTACLPRLHQQLVAAPWVQLCRAGCWHQMRLQS